MSSCKCRSSPSRPYIVLLQIFKNVCSSSPYHILPSVKKSLPKLIMLYCIFSVYKLNITDWRKTSAWTCKEINWPELQNGWVLLSFQTQCLFWFSKEQSSLSPNISLTALSIFFSPFRSIGLFFCYQRSFSKAFF